MVSCTLRRVVGALALLAVSALGHAQSNERFPFPGTGNLPDCDTSRSQARCPSTGGGSTGTPTIPGTATAIDGVCGPSANQLEESQPTGASACAAGTFQNRPNTTSQWRWDCEGENGGSNQFCTAQRPTPPSVSLSANPRSVEDGDSTRLSWSASDADSCTRSGDWSGSSSTSGSLDRGPLSAGRSYSYTLRCTNSAGLSDSDSVTVTVADPAPPVTVNLGASPSSVQEGGSVNLSWTSTGADSCTANTVTWGAPTASPGGPAPQNGWPGPRSTSGSFNYSPVSTNYGASAVRFRITCQNSGGESDTGQVTVQVTDAPPTQNPVQATLAASPTTIDEGDSTTLTWSSQNAGHCEITGVADNYTDGRLNGSHTVAPGADTTYRLTCYGDEDSSVTGTSSERVTVNDTPATPSVSLTTSPSTIDEGESTALSWSASNATSCVFAGTSGTTRPTSGTFYPSPSSSRSWTITCRNGDESDAPTASDSASVTVRPPSRQQVTVSCTNSGHVGSPNCQQTPGGGLMCGCKATQAVASRQPGSFRLESGTGDAEHLSRCESQQISSSEVRVEVIQNTRYGTYTRSCTYSYLP